MEKENKVEQTENIKQIKGLSITPVKPDKDAIKYKKTHPYLPQSPFVLGLISPRQTGKSTIISWLLLHDEALGQDYYHKVYIFSPTIEQCETSRFLRKRYDCDTIYSDDKLQNIINQQEQLPKGERKHICVVFDDCIGDESMKKKSLLTSFVTKSRHWNADIIISIQHFRSMPKITRTNLTDVLIGYPITNAKMKEELAQEFGENFEEGDKGFLKYYELSTKKTRYNYMNLKLRANPIEVYSTFEERIL